MSHDPLPVNEIPDAAKHVLRQIAALYIEQFTIVLAEAGIKAPVATDASKTGFCVFLDRTSLSGEQNARIPALMQEVERRVQALRFTLQPDARLN